jgi:hypothetical protein
MPFNFGFNEEALHSIKRQLQDLHLDFRRGSFFWDEMSLTIDVKYDAQKMPFEGFIDYGKEEIEDNNTEFTDQLADAHTDRHGSSLSLFPPLKQRNMVT